MADPIRYIVLLRAINVGKRQAPMAVLRSACEQAGFGDVRSHIASGNLLLTGADGREAVEHRIERIVAETFGFGADAVARTVPEWRGYAANAPFAPECRTRPKMVHLALSKRPPAHDAPAVLAVHATLGERFVLQGDALWADFVGVGQSKVTPALLNRAAGSPVTMRNWNTVLALLALAEG